MKDKIVLITGSNAGIGKATAVELAKLGATVVASARNPEKGRRAVDEIRHQSASSEVHLLVGDLGSLAGVRALAADFVDRWDRLDVLVNNAGVFLTERSETEDGFETTFAVNHLAPFLLTHLLLDLLEAYLHFTSNNTVYGTQFQQEPDVAATLVCDASSDFLSRPLDLDRYGLIYAGAQKNIGPAGVTVVLIKDSFLQQRKESLPTILDYGTHAAKLFNTPPVFAIYVVEKVLRWLDRLGGIDAIAQINEAKAAQLYGRIDRTGFYQGTAQVGSRSKMNVTFRLPTEALEQQFVAQAKAHGLLALKGHRSVGGIRASIYNACAPASVAALVSFMDDFERQNG